MKNEESSVFSQLSLVDLMCIGGFLSLVTGVAMLNVPAALIVAGALMLVLAVKGAKS